MSDKYHTQWSRQIARDRGGIKETFDEIFNSLFESLLDYPIQCSMCNRPIGLAEIYAARYGERIEFFCYNCVCKEQP